MPALPLVILEVSEVVSKIFESLYPPVWEIFKLWWWLPVPLVLFFPLRYLYLWYIEDKWFDEIEWVMVEVKMPREIDRPIKAMEQVMNGFWVVYDAPDFKERWLEGKFLLRFSLEVASIDGVVHFFIRMARAMKEIFEAAVYSQYPEVEIQEVPDYTKDMPQNVPNKEWDLWGCDYELSKGNCYPIRTYAKFFEPSPEYKEEERRIDPLAVLVEGLSKLKKGEQFWFQIVVKPITDEQIPWTKECKKLVDKLVRRPEEAKPKSIISLIGGAFQFLITGKLPEEEKKKEELIPPEMKLTPGEREIVSSIEEKIGKQGFETNVRFIYFGKKELFFKGRLRFGLNFTNSFSTVNLNTIKPWGKTITKVTPPAPFREKRLYLRQRRLFKRYIRRWSPLFPASGGTFILNAEELASLFHFPSEAGAPTPAFPRIEAKKGGPPPSLPTE